MCGRGSIAVGVLSLLVASVSSADDKSSVAEQRVAWLREKVGRLTQPHSRRPEASISI